MKVLKPSERITLSQISHYIQVLVVLWLAAFLRFYRLGFQSLWSDEGNSFALSQASFGEIASRTAFDIHPPLYYWLLKIWTNLVGTSEFGLRSLSALWGILLVAVVYRLGKSWFNPGVGLVAALLVAVSPFEVYYAQEARMYMQLAALSGLSVWLAWLIWQTETAPVKHGARVGYGLVIAAGLYTQYTFPLIWVIINLAAVVRYWSYWRKLGGWLAWQFLPLLLYAPWLPIAYRQLTTWPSLVETMPSLQLGLLLSGYLTLWTPVFAVGEGWLLPFILIFLIGLALILDKCRSHIASLQRQTRKQLRRVSSTKKLMPQTATQINLALCLLLILWFAGPLGLTYMLFRPAYLKFLLVASPALCLLLGVGLAGKVQHIGEGGEGASHAWRTVIGLPLLLIPSLLALQHLYFTPTFQRDNYRGIATYIQAIATPEDRILIHAPGQQEVFGYYYGASPTQATVVPLPRQRPMEKIATRADLETLVTDAERIYAVYWATTEADPTGLIEAWLDENTFKASDTWFGNVRLVSYATPSEGLTAESLNLTFTKAIELQDYSLSATTLSPGEILQLGFTWRTNGGAATDYVVFVQLIDAANHLVAQRDAQPVLPTSQWGADLVLKDRHGLLIAPGTPPGPHQLIMGLYDAATGQRLSFAEGQDHLNLGTINVGQNRSPLPLEAFTMQHPLHNPPLLGYDRYKLGHASKPETPLFGGDPLHLNLYWQKPLTLPANVDETIEIMLLDGAGKVVTAWEKPLAGVNYPLADWREGEIVRAQFDLFLPQVSAGNYKVHIIWAGQELAEIPLHLEE